MSSYARVGWDICLGLCELEEERHRERKEEIENERQTDRLTSVSTKRPAIDLGVTA